MQSVTVEQAAERLNNRVQNAIRGGPDDDLGEQWEVFITKVTPEMATLWMKQDRQGNRPIRRLAVEEYTRDMKSGVWNLATDAIAFNDAGQLLNGRHRLLAIIESGVTIDSIILLGKTTVYDIDGGVHRGPSDYFHLRGVANSTRCAAACRIVAEWEINRLASMLNIKHSVSELWKVWERHPGLIRSVEYVQGFPQGKLVQIGHQSTLMAFHYLFATEDQALSDAYLDGVVTADGVRSTDPVALVRDRFIQIKMDASRKTVPLREWQHLLAKGWKATVAGKTLKILKIHRTEAFPIIGPST
jgi:hypothetical protein